jgi:hypothetical protein
MRKGLHLLFVIKYEKEKDFDHVSKEELYVYVDFTGTEQ